MIDPNCITLSFAKLEIELSNKLRKTIPDFFPNIIVLVNRHLSYKSKIFLVYIHVRVCIDTQVAVAHIESKDDDSNKKHQSQQWQPQQQC